MKKFRVPVQARELVWNEYVAIVEANSREEALEKVKASDNPFYDFNPDENGINTVTLEVIETEEYSTEETFLDRIKEVEKYSYQAEFKIFDLLRLEKDAIYAMVESEIPNIDEIYEMDIIPVGISGKSVTLKFVPTKYKE